MLAKIYISTCIRTDTQMHRRIDAHIYVERDCSDCFATLKKDSAREIRGAL